MTSELVQLNSDTFVQRGTAQWRFGTTKKLMGLRIVSAILPNGKRQDIDSSNCMFLCKALCDRINKLEDR